MLRPQNTVKYLIAALEIVGVTLALATENYWWISIALVAGIFDLFSSFKKNK